MIPLLILALGLNPYFVSYSAKEVVIECRGGRERVELPFTSTCLWIEPVKRLPADTLFVAAYYATKNCTSIVPLATRSKLCDEFRWSMLYNVKLSNHRIISCHSDLINIAVVEGRKGTRWRIRRTTLWP